MGVGVGTSSLSFCSVFLVPFELNRETGTIPLTRWNYSNPRLAVWDKRPPSTVFLPEKGKWRQSLGFVLKKKNKKQKLKKKKTNKLCFDEKRPQLTERSGVHAAGS